jgi:hypothetical protein
MSADKRKSVVREPVQVYLTAADRKLLREVAVASGVSGAEVLRRGLRRVAGEVLGEQGPAMRLLEEMNAAEWPSDMPGDVGRNHDQHLADATYPKPGRARRVK